MSDPTNTNRTDDTDRTQHVPTDPTQQVPTTDPTRQVPLTDPTQQLPVDDGAATEPREPVETTLFGAAARGDLDDRTAATESTAATPSRTPAGAWPPPVPPRPTGPHAPAILLGLVCLAVAGDRPGAGARQPHRRLGRRRPARVRRRRRGPGRPRRGRPDQLEPPQLPA